MASYTERVAFTQVLNILDNIEKTYYDKIPTETINIFRNNKIENYQYYDEKGRTKISELAEQILCYLNLEYWCDEKEKNELINSYNKNDEILNVKYNINNILKKRNKIKNIEKFVQTEEKNVVEYKEKWFKRLLSFFRRRN